MNNLKEKFYKNTNSFTQFVWVIIVRIIGLIMFISPLYLPIIAYYSALKENIEISKNEYIFATLGFMLFAGGKTVGIILNTLGVAFTNVIGKLTK